MSRDLPPASMPAENWERMAVTAMARIMTATSTSSRVNPCRESRGRSGRSDGVGLFKGDNSCEEINANDK